MFRKQPILPRMDELKAALLPKPSEDHLTSLESILDQLDKEINRIRSNKANAGANKSIQAAMDTIVGKTKVGLLYKLKKMNHIVVELKKNLYEITSCDMTLSEQKTNKINMSVKNLYEKFCALVSNTEKTDNYLEKNGERLKLKDISKEFKTILEEINNEHLKYESNEAQILSITAKKL